MNKEVIDKLIEKMRPGMTIQVFEKIKEINPKGEEKERIQMFEGILISHKGGSSIEATIMVRKSSGGIGVEKIFPLHLPAIEKIDILKASKVRRAKLFYLRKPHKKMKRVDIEKKA